MLHIEYCSFIPNVISINGCTWSLCVLLCSIWLAQAKVKMSWNFSSQYIEYGINHWFLSLRWFYAWIDIWQRDFIKSFDFSPVKIHTCMLKLTYIWFVYTSVTSLIEKMKGCVWGGVLWWNSNALNIESRSQFFL